MSLAKARERREEARRLLADQIDPSARKKAERLAEADKYFDPLTIAIADRVALEQWIAAGEPWRDLKPDEDNPWLQAR